MSRPGDDRRLRLRDVFNGVIPGLPDDLTPEQHGRIARLLILIGLLLLIATFAAWIVLAAPGNHPSARAGATTAILPS